MPLLYLKSTPVRLLLYHQISQYYLLILPIQVWLRLMQYLFIALVIISIKFSFVLKIGQKKQQTLVPRYQSVYYAYTHTCYKNGSSTPLEGFL